MLNIDSAKQLTPQTIKFSIVVPIYNTSKYLPKCIESVLSQQYENFELILVNDGSTDASGEICSGYAKKDRHVVYISKENGGVSSARNAGIRAASGEYIIFLDSDDWICEDILEKASHIIAETNRKDIYLGDYWRYHSEKDNPIIRKFTTKQALLDRATPYEVLERVEWSKWNNAPCLNTRCEIFRRDIMLESNVFFDESLSWREDADYFLAYMIKCASFGLLGFPVCFYRLTRQGSLTNIRRPEASVHTYRVMKHWCEYFVQAYAETGNKAARSLASYFANELFTSIVSLAWHPEYGGVHTLMKENSPLLKYNRGWKMSIKKVLYSFIRFDTASRIIGRLKKLRSAMRQKLGRG